MIELGPAYQTHWWSGHDCEVYAETGSCPHQRSVWARLSYIVIDMGHHVREDLAQTRSDFTKAW